MGDAAVRRRMMKRSGVIAIPTKGFDGDYRKCKFEVTCFDEPDTRGLEGGKIDYMAITMDGELIAEHSGGWLLEPACREAEIAASILIYELN